MTVSTCRTSRGEAIANDLPLPTPPPPAAVPHQLLSKINRIISLAEKDSISTAKVSSLLELLSKAYKYGRIVSHDKFILRETSVTALDKCDAAFKRFLSSSIKGEEDQAKEELQSCERFAGKYSFSTYHQSTPLFW